LKSPKAPVLGKAPAGGGAERAPEACRVYGPVPSRRLGFSLGVDILPHKTCSFDCVYCQLVRNARKTTWRVRYFDAREILAEIERAMGSGRRIDTITFSGSGEPTLNSQIGRLIRDIKKLTPTPVVVLTNSSLLGLASVRRALRAADIVIPSLDAATAASFRRVNRPHPSLRVENVTAGLEKFRSEFKGQIWLEVMLVKGVNDSREDIEAIKRAIARIRPDKVQLNTVVRPPAEVWAKPLAGRDLERIRKKLGGRAEIIAQFRKTQPAPRAGDLRREILAMVERRPVTVKDMASSLGSNPAEIRRQLLPLLRGHRIRPVKHAGTVYYEAGKLGAE
jgi:wyosine [tRNA(Phe)-imidazoG37] synthetase (radical SAM superfamily)